MKKNAIGIRCHNIGPSEKKLYSFCEKYFGAENTFFVLNIKDADKKIPNGFKSIIFNEETVLNSEDLFWPQDAAWRCGDYCYYAMWHCLRGYEFFWLIEPDVKICTDTAKEFFSEFEDSNFDFIAPYFAVAGESIPFFYTTKYLEADPHTCLFCVTRFRASIVPNLLKIRKKISERFRRERINQNLYPNDEVFISSLGVRLGFRFAAMEKLSSYNFSLFSAFSHSGFLEQEVEGVRGKFVMHPVLKSEAFMEKKFRVFRNTLNGSRGLIDFVTETIRKCPDPEMKEEFRKKFSKDFEDYLKTIK